MDFDADGNLYVVELEGTVGLHMISSSGTLTTVTTNISFTNPASITYNSIGDIFYIGDTGNDEIYELHPNGTAFVICESINPTGLAADETNTLYVTDISSGTIYKLNVTDRVPEFSPEVGTLLGVMIVVPVIITRRRRRKTVP